MNYAAPNGKECCKIPTVASSLLLSTAAGPWPWRPKALLSLFLLVKLLMASITYDFKFFSSSLNCLILYFF